MLWTTVLYKNASLNMHQSTAEAPFHSYLNQLSPGPPHCPQPLTSFMLILMLPNLSKTSPSKTKAICLGQLSLQISEMRWEVVGH